MAGDLNTPTLPRRAILAGGAAGLLPALPVEAAPKQDAELLRLGQAFEAAWAHEAELQTIQNSFAGVCDAYWLAEDRTMEAASRVHALVTVIQAIPARTLEGLRIKARAAHWLNQEPGFAETAVEHDMMRPMAVSILNDLLNLGV